MLHLNTGINLDEVEVALVLIDEKLHGTRVLIAHFTADRQGRIEQALAHVVVQRQRRSDFHHFLVPPLHGAVALEEMDQVAVLVAQELDFYVARLLDETLDEDVRTAKSR